MKCSININHFKVNSLSNNSSIILGPSYQDGHTVTSTIIGSTFNYGDNGLVISKSFNC